MKLTECIRISLSWKLRRRIDIQQINNHIENFDMFRTSAHTRSSRSRVEMVRNSLFTIKIIHE